MARHQTTLIGLAVILAVAICFCGNLFAAEFDPEHPEWLFDEAGNREGWTEEHSINIIGVSEGTLKMEITGEDPWIFCGLGNTPLVWEDQPAYLNVDAEEHPTLYARMALSPNNNLIEIFGVTEDNSEWSSGEYKCWDTLTPSGKMEKYEFQMDWDGTITGLRMDFSEDMPGIEVEIDYLSFVGHKGGSIFLENKTVNPGDQFTVDISGRFAEALSSFAFDLTFDPSVLRAISVEAGPFLSRGGADATFWLEPVIDNENGVIRNVRCSRAGAEGVEEKGILAIATFEALDVGSTDLSIQNLHLLSPSGEEIEAPTTKGLVVSKRSFNWVLSLDGDGDYVYVPSAPELRGGANVVKTIEAWFFLSKRHPAFPVITKVVDDSLKDWSINGIEWTQIQFWSEGAGPDYRPPAAPGSEISVSQWHHVAAVINRPELLFRLYLDGTLVIEDVNMGNNCAATDAPVEIGAISYYENFATGYFDEVRIWNTARTQKQIQATMNTTLTGQEEGLVGYWNFDDGTAKDLSPNGNDGALQGDAHIVESPSPGELQNGDFEAGVGTWEFQIMEPEAQADIQIVDTGGIIGSRCVHANIINADTSWHVVVGQDNLTAMAGQTYTVSVFLKADRNRWATLELKRSPSLGDWEGIATKEVEITTEWAEYHLTFVPTKDYSGTAFFGIWMAHTTGEVWIDGARLSQGEYSEASAVDFLEDKIVNPGDQFTMYISVFSGKELHSFAFDIKFDPSVLRAVGVEEGSFLSRDGMDATSWQTPAIDNENGVVRNIRCSRTGKEGVRDKGILAVATFEAIGMDSTDLSIQNLQLLSASGEEMEAWVEDGTIDVYPHGSISGVVLDSANGNPIEGARVRTYEDDLSGYSAADGTYTINRVPVGDFAVTASKHGYMTRTIPTVGVEQGRTTGDINISLNAVQGAMSVDIAMYVEQTGWMSIEVANIIGEEIEEAVGDYVKSIGVFSEEELPEWIHENMGDDDIDIIFLFGDFPDSIYPSGNAQPDGSLAELFLEDGNMFLNTADYIFWANGRNNQGGLTNMLDCPQLYINLGGPVPMEVTPLGRQYLSSLGDFGSTRPLPTDRLSEDWEVEASFADDGGARADPVVVRNKTYDGRVAIFFQRGEGEEDLPRPEVISEFILNWLPTIAGPAIVVETTPANPDEQFTVDLSVKSIAEPHSFSFDLTFDPSVLQAVSVKGGGLETEIDNEKGIIAGIHSRAQDAGVLVAVTFQAAESGSSSISLQNLQTLNSSGEEAIIKAKAGEVDVYPHGSISGVILDAVSKQPIQRVEVELSRRNFTFGFSAYSADDGSYMIDGVPLGDFDVTAMRDDYIPETIPEIRVEQGKNTGNIDMNLTSFDTASIVTIMTPIAVGESATDFVLQDIDGNQIMPSDFAGKPIILNFWDSASEHCQRQIPHLDALYKKYQGDGLVMIGVSKEMANEDTLEFARSQMSYTVILNGAEAFQAYGVTSIPCTYYIGKAGKVQRRHVGYRDESTLEADIKTLLTEE